jgi:hypothetical protein
MRLKLVKASQGLTWVRQGMQVCRQQPLGFVGLLGMTSLAAMLLMALLADAGLAVVTCLAPTVWMGFMLGSRRVLTGQAVTPTVMLEPFRGDRHVQRDFLILGVLYGLAMLVALQIAAWLGPDPEVLADIKDKAKDVADVLMDPLVQQSMMLDFVLTLPVTLLFLHTPALVLWARVPVGKALFFSAVASSRNLGAFIVFGCGWGLVAVGLALGAGLVASLLPVPVLVNALTMAASMWLAAAFYASLYFTVVDCFEPSDTAGQPPSTEPT